MYIAMMTLRLHSRQSCACIDTERVLAGVVYTYSLLDGSQSTKPNNSKSNTAERRINAVLEQRILSIERKELTLRSRPKNEVYISGCAYFRTV